VYLALGRAATLYAAVSPAQIEVRPEIETFGFGMTDTANGFDSHLHPLPSKTVTRTDFIPEAVHNTDTERALLPPDIVPPSTVHR
jgi:hypothetical protein